MLIQQEADIAETNTAHGGRPEEAKQDTGEWKGKLDAEQQSRLAQSAPYDG